MVFRSAVLVFAGFMLASGNALAEAPVARDAVRAIPVSNDGQPGTSERISAEALAEAVLARVEELKGVKAGARFAKQSKAQAPDVTNAIRAFYRMRQGGPLWVSADGLNDNADTLIAVTSDADSWGLDPKAFTFAAAAKAGGGDALPTAGALADQELALTRIALTYAAHARGGRVDPVDLSNDIFRQRPLIAPASVLTDIAVAEDLKAYLVGLHPQHQQFKLLQLAYLKLRDGGDAAAGDEAEAADAKPQGKKKRKAKRKPMTREQKLRRIRLNMEMWRWMPEELGATHVIANIPAFKVRLNRDGQTIFEERVVVGKYTTQTPLFSDVMEHIIFRPTWGVPNSIKVRELLPGLLRGGDPISRKGLRLQVRGRDANPRSVNWRRADIRNYTVYQPSGPRNALGNVKFMFPNRHAIYMHDTPSKHLFKRSTRMYSHGCIRIRNPQNFAKVLLKTANDWAADQTAQTYKRGPNKEQVNFDAPIPVHLIYATAWVDPKTEKLSFFKDVYKHERHLKFALAGDYRKIRKVRRSVSADYQTIRASVRARSSSQSWLFNSGGGSSSGGNKDWMKNVFNSD